MLLFFGKKVDENSHYNTGVNYGGAAASTHTPRSKWAVFASVVEPIPPNICFRGFVSTYPKQKSINSAIFYKLSYSAIYKNIKA